MKALTFGWEFPPHISGGLGTACFGLTSALLQQGVEVLLVVPRLYGDEDKNRFRFINASEIELDFKQAFYFEQMKRLSYIQVHSFIVPYMPPEIFANEKRFSQTNSLSGDYKMHFEFSGQYGRNLMMEVAQYALVASEIAKSNTFDIIHAHDWLTYPAGMMAKEVSGKPLVVHVHATEFDRSGDNINHDVYEVEKRGYQCADAIIAVSGYTKQILVEKYGLPVEKIAVVHNAVLQYQNGQLEKNSLKESAAKSRSVVTFLGRITFQKGPEYFVNAARKVLDKFPQTHFVMAGSGDMMSKIIKMVAELKMGSRFHFTGFLNGEETENVYAMSDVYVMPSVSEPFGIAPLEAIKAGVPVIISKQSGVSEVLQHAIKVDFWDIDALADAISGLLQYKPLSKTFVREGGKEIEHLQWAKAALKVKDIYQTLINKRT